MSDNTPTRIWWCEMENFGWGTKGINSNPPECVLRLPEDVYLHNLCGWRLLSEETDPPWKTDHKDTNSNFGGGV